MHLKPAQLNFLAGVAAGVALCLGLGVWQAKKREGHAARQGMAGIRAHLRALSAVPGSDGNTTISVDRETVLKRLRSILSLGDPLDRTRSMLTYVARLEPGDFPMNLEACRTLNLPASAEEYEMLFTAWSKVDHLAALDCAGEDRVAIRTILNAWAVTDPEAAHDWVRTHHGGDDPNPLLGIVIPAIAGNDRDRAMALVAGLPREDRWFVFHQMVPQVLEQGPEAVRTWLATVPEPLRNEAVAQVVNETPPRDAAQAVEWLREYPLAVSSANVSGIFRTWWEADRDAALATYLSLGTGRLRQEALRGLVYQQVFRGHAEAALVMMEQSPDEVDDSMLTAWVRPGIATNPAHTLDSVLELQDSDLRSAAYRRALQQWCRTDPEAARKWMTARGLPEGLLSRVTDP